MQTYMVKLTRLQGGYECDVHSVVQARDEQHAEQLAYQTQDHSSGTNCVDMETGQWDASGDGEVLLELYSIKLIPCELVEHIRKFM
jgi:hypothetical protein